LRSLWAPQPVKIAASQIDVGRAAHRCAGNPIN
jgi:hypothetical protein